MTGSSFIDWFNVDSTEKLIEISFDDVVITNEDLYNQEMTVEESLCSEDRLIFGACESSVIKFKVLNIVQPMEGKEINVNIFLPEFFNQPFQLGVYTVKSDKPASDRTWREIVAYDALYDITNSDYKEWYHSFFNGRGRAKIREFRNAFFSHIGIEQYPSMLVNDNIYITETLDSDKIIGRDILTALCEINGRFGHIRRYNDFRYIELYPIYRGIYPSDDLYPSNDLYPDDGDFTDIPKNLYTSCEYEDFETSKITGISTVLDSGEVVFVGSDENVYTISENFMLYGQTAETARVMLSNLLEEIKDIAYKPFKVSCKGNPCFEVGDIVRVETENDVVFSYILSRTMTGTGALTDEYSSKGVKKIPEAYSSEKNEIKAVQKTVRQTKSSIEQTNKNIVLKVDSDGNIVEVSLGVSADDESATEFTVKADNIELTAQEAIALLGKRIDLTANEISLVSNNWTLTPDGKMTCKSADILGGTINIESEYNSDNKIVLLFYRNDGMQEGSPVKSLIKSFFDNGKIGVGSGLRWGDHGRDIWEKELYLTDNEIVYSRPDDNNGDVLQKIIFEYGSGIAGGRAVMAFDSNYIMTKYGMIISPSFGDFSDWYLVVNNDGFRRYKNNILKGGIQFDDDWNVVPHYNKYTDLGSGSKRFGDLYICAIDLDGNIIPLQNKAYDLGSENNKFNNVYTESIYTRYIYNDFFEFSVSGIRPTADMRSILGSADLRFSLMYLAFYIIIGNQSDDGMYYGSSSIYPFGDSANLGIQSHNFNDLYVQKIHINDKTGQSVKGLILEDEKIYRSENKGIGIDINGNVYPLQDAHLNLGGNDFRFYWVYASRGIFLGNDSQGVSVTNYGIGAYGDNLDIGSSNNPFRRLYLDSLSLNKNATIKGGLAVGYSYTDDDNNSEIIRASANENHIFFGYSKEDGTASFKVRIDHTTGNYRATGSISVNGDIHSGSGNPITSDKRYKYDIETIDADTAERLIELIEPVSFKYTTGSSGRTHYGVIADQVLKSIDEIGIDSDDFAPYVNIENVSTEGEETTMIKGIRYTEFIPLLWREAQKAIEDRRELKRENEKLKREIAEIKEMIKDLKGDVE